MKDWLEEAADRWGTPIYVTDVDAALANAERWREAYPEALIAYAVKANPDPALLRRLAEQRFGFEVVGPVELALALRAPCSPEMIVVNGVGQTDADLAEALATGALVNAESLGALDALLAVRPGRIGVRVNPALDAGAHPHLATGAAASKFGVALEDLPEAIARVRKAGVKLSSIGAHIGSGITDPQPFGRLAQLLARFAAETGAQGIDLGGGFAGAPNDHADGVRSHLPAGVPLILEPGRSIVGDSGWLVTRVVRVQERGHLVADAGMSELIRPMLYGARHPVSLVRPGATLADRRWTLSGPICEAGDILAHDLELGAESGEGALLAIGDVGAYGFAMSSNYNGRLRPAQAVIDRGELRLSRRRETLDDLVWRDVE